MSSSLSASLRSSSGVGHGVFFVALAENKAREIGLACFNVSLSQLVFCQYSDTSAFSLTLAQLHLYSPREILVPHTTAQSQLSSILRERFGSATCNVAEVNRKFFNEATGLASLQALSSTPLTLDRLESKYLSLAAAAAVVKYVEYVQQTSFANASLKITYRALDGFLHMDTETVRNLELVRNLRSGETKTSLFGLLDHTQVTPLLMIRARFECHYFQTAAGARLLRTSILQPPSDRSTIDLRLATVLSTRFLLGLVTSSAASCYFLCSISL